MVQLTMSRDKFVHAVIESQDTLLEFGRQFVDEPPPPSVRSLEQGQRLIIAEMQNLKVGRRQLRLEPIQSGRVRLTNIHEKINVIADGSVLVAGGSLEFLLPTDLRIGDIHLHIEAAESPEDHFHTLGERPDFTESQDVGLGSSVHSLIATLKRGDHRSLLYRLEQLVQVLQASVSSPDFMERVASLSVELIELDHAAVVLLKDNIWAVVASSSARPCPEDDEWYPSRSLLNQVRSNQKTTWSRPGQLMQTNSLQSLTNVLAYVAAPIRNPQGEVIGAIYGDRRTGIGAHCQPIEEIDAQFVEILACGVAGGLQRLENEREVLTRRLQLEQFVNEEVRRQIDEDPNWSTGRDADVTILFCDIAGFSRISEQLPPQQTFEWINDVMAALSECVKRHGGTIVDYVGDELIAMWGAPLANENHPSDACRAATAIAQCLPKIDAKWQSLLHSRTEVGVGVNSGMVRVGNTGCELKLKYGPLGSTVNIASRIQGATRYLRTSVLITGDTAKRIPDEFAVRRLCKLRVKNIVSPIDIYELFAEPPANWNLRCSDYAKALSAWEEGSLKDAVNRLVKIVATYEDDVPAKVMLSRAIDVWSRDQTEHDPVWTLPSK